MLCFCEESFSNEFSKKSKSNGIFKVPAGFFQALIQKYHVTPADLKDAKSSSTFSLRWKSELIEKAKGKMMGDMNNVGLRSNEISYLESEGVRIFFG